MHKIFLSLPFVQLESIYLYFCLYWIGEQGNIYNYLYESGQMAKCIRLNILKTKTINQNIAMIVFIRYIFFFTYIKVFKLKK